MKPSDVAWSIRERILAFESRVEEATLEVRPEGPRSHFNQMRFAIQGSIRADRMSSIDFLVYSTLDLESGTARVSPP
jgi:predicted component of type VI protein secretion system